MKVRCLLLAALLLAAASAAADDLAALLEPIRAKHGLPALAGAVLVGDRVTHIGATGVRVRGEDDPVTPEDRWHLGSCGKAISATAIARLVERQTLRWEQTLAESPVFADVLRAEYRTATLRQLLEHRAGVPPELATLPIWPRLYRYPGTSRDARLALARVLLEKPATSPPGTAYRYSNGGYTIAGVLAEQATDTAWEELLETEVLAPLGMRSAGFGAPGAVKGQDEPWGHREDGSPVPHGPAADNPPALAPAGTLHASLRDWARFVALHLSAYGGKPKLLTAERLRALHVPPEGSEYAAGWVAVQRPWAGGTALTHGGSNTMWKAVVWMAPERGFAVLVTTNQGGAAAEKGTDDAAGALIRHHQRYD